MAVLHQALPILHRRDAVGTHTLHVRDLLRQHGVDSDIFVGITDRETVADTRPIADYDGGPVVYQYAVSSAIVAELCARADVVAINSHNSTPAHHFASWDPALVGATSTSGRELRILRPNVRLAVADSTYNAQQLRAYGYDRSTVVPVLFDAPGTDGAAGEVDEHQWLFVGRIVPNKAQHDLVLGLAAARRHFDPRATLVLAGATSSVPYAAALRRLVDRLGLAGAVTVTGPLADDQLRHLYATSGVYVSASDHEGFGVPLVEAMASGLPVVAYGAAAVAETVADGGIVLDMKRPLDLAAAAWETTRPSRRQKLIAAGHRRAARFALERTRLEMWTALEPVVADR
ncbi:MAG: glycosyltransferase family 4 protein [Ilumatobacteraceae bacterium]